MEQLSREAMRRRLAANAFPLFPDLESAFERIGFVQADPIRSPARAQDLILRQRVAGYRAGDLEAQYPDLEVEEGFLFAYGFVRPDVWRLLPRPAGKRLSQKQRAALAAVKELEEAHPRDLERRLGKRSVVNAWGGRSQESKRLLEDLHDLGLLKVRRRVNGIRTYSPVADPSCGIEDPEARFSSLVLAAVGVMGPVRGSTLLSELSAHSHLLPDRKRRMLVLTRLVSDGRMDQVELDGVTYFWIRNQWPDREPEATVRILAPFDPLVRDRDRFERLWGWSYRFEAYVPKAKRQRGYYAMPILWKDSVVGWANAIVKSGVLYVDLGYEHEKPSGKGFWGELENEVERMAVFLGLASGSWELPV